MTKKKDNSELPWYFEINTVHDAQEMARRGKKVVVHLIDECINFDLKGLQNKNYSEVIKCNDKSHGTAMAGIIASELNILPNYDNKKEDIVAEGIAPESLIKAYNIKNDLNNFKEINSFLDTEVTQYNKPYFIGNERFELITRINIVNLSGAINGSIYTKADWEAELNKLCRPNIILLLVVAAGNDSKENNNNKLPHSLNFENCIKKYEEDPKITVGVFDYDDYGNLIIRSEYSSGKNYLDIIAPGINIPILYNSWFNSEMQVSFRSL